MKKPSTIIILVFFLVLIQRVRTLEQSTAASGFEPTPSNDHNSKGPPWRVMVVASLLFLGGYLIYLFCFIRVSNWRTWQPPWRQFTTSLRQQSPTSTARTLDLAVVKSFPTFKYAAIKSGIITNNKPAMLECAVCLAEYDDNDVLRLIPKCDHVFHADCVDEWLVEHATCPVCRLTLENVEFRNVQNQRDVVLEEENEMMRSLSGRLRLFTGLRRSFSAGHVEERQTEDMERFRITGEMREEIMSTCKSEKIGKGKGKGNWVFGLTDSSREELEKEKGVRSLSAATNITTKEKGSSSMQLAV